MKEIRESLLKDEKILWKSIKFINLKHRFVYGFVIILSLLISFPVVFYLLSPLIGWFLFFLALVLCDGFIGSISVVSIFYARRAMKRADYTFEKLVRFEQVSIFTNKRIIQRDLKYIYKTNTPIIKEGLGRHFRDTVFLNLELIEKIAVYKFKKKIIFQFWLAKEKVLEGPSMVEFKIKNDDYRVLWTAINSNIFLGENTEDPSDIVEIYYRVKEEEYDIKFDHTKTILEDAAPYCPYCGKPNDIEDRLCRYCGKSLE